jgi:hypothetical protein
MESTEVRYSTTLPVPLLEFLIKHVNNKQFEINVKTKHRPVTGVCVCD